MSSLISTLYLMDKYGPRMGMDCLAQVLGMATHTLLQRIARADLGIPTYLDGKMRYADTRDVAEYLDLKREQARLSLAA